MVGDPFGEIMVKYFKIVAYLITRFALKVNPKIKFSYLGDSIGWGFIFVNLWLSLVFYELIIESFYPKFIDQYTYGKIINPVMLTVAILMISEFFIFFYKDQWKDFIPVIEQMDEKERRKLCWRVIWFLILAVPLSIVLLIIKHPKLVTWTG